jgi:hypothetical protein
VEAERKVAIVETACYFFDIDGTLADLTHRLAHVQKQPKDWDAFNAACVHDAPVPHIARLARDLALSAPIVCVSGRTDKMRLETDAWIRTMAGFVPSGLYMRREGDRRPDDIVKGELLRILRADGWSPIMAFDDRDRVVKMWRINGVPCAQVAEGEF